jgi:spore coat protein A
MPNLKPFQDRLPVPEVVEPILNATEKHLSFKAKIKHVKLHKDLPSTEVWSYRLAAGRVINPGSGSTYLGPTVNIQRGENVEVRWANKVKTASYAAGTLPFEVVKIDPAAVPGTIPQNEPGKDGALNDAQDRMRPMLRQLKASLVTHLHGGRSQADSDGWPDNIAAVDQSNFYSYSNNQAAATLWYHDHANHVTRLNVYAGLAGAWLIRDEEENCLNLPDGEFELPLVIQDRNLDVEGGSFNGKVLHKTEVNGGPAEFFGPYTLVNGKIWPKTEVEPRLYRLRILNGSNARTYRLMLLDNSGNGQHASIWQIGCDQGLLENKLTYPVEGLVLAPGERIDLLVDFAAFADQSLYLWNTAEAPFGNNAITTDPAGELSALLADPFAGNSTDDNRRPFPQIMRFDVQTDASSPSHTVPADPLWQPKHPKIEITANMPIRLMGLVEKPADPAQIDSIAMLVFAEYVQITPHEPAPTGAEVVAFNFFDPKDGSARTESFWKGAEEFYDKVNWKVHLGATEQWYIVNVSPDTHPVHVHLVDMDVNQRYEYALTGTTDDAATPFPNTKPWEIDGNIHHIASITATNALSVETGQKGPKDTVRINPNEMIGVAMKFSPYPGKYLYHCHILEHEDHDMMRPFVIVDPSIPHHSH